MSKLFFIFPFCIGLCLSGCKQDTDINTAEVVEAGFVDPEVDLHEETEEDIKKNPQPQQKKEENKIKTVKNEHKAEPTSEVKTEETPEKKNRTPSIDVNTKIEYKGALMLPDDETTSSIKSICDELVLGTDPATATGTVFTDEQISLMAINGFLIQGIAGDEDDDYEYSIISDGTAGYYIINKDQLYTLPDDIRKKIGNKLEKFMESYSIF